MLKVRLFRKVAKIVAYLAVVRKVKLLVVFVAVIGLGSLCAFSVKKDICSGEQHIFCSETCSTFHGTEDGICPDCAGKGMVKCSNCLGKGELRKSCNKCSGHGTIREVCGSEIIGTENCSQCKGKGWYNGSVTPYKCPTCNGSGYYREDGRQQKCGYCNNGFVNTGRKDCDRCNGKGTINLERNNYCNRNCNSCFGDGFLITACTNCNQTGLKPCTRCNTTGKVN